MTAAADLNADLLYLARLSGLRCRSYRDWLAVGRQVRRGEKQKRWLVRRADGKVFCCWGFEESQLYPTSEGQVR